METLVIIGIERTGTNYLCSLLNQIPSVEARFELFANVAAISLTQLEIDLIAQIADQPFTDKTDPRLVQYLKHHVEKTLTIIQEKLPPRKQMLSFKIFRDHLPQPTLRTLIQQHHTVFVTRRVIDTYISFMKALESQAWIYQDTTFLKPELKIEHFTYWYQQTYRYYWDCVDHYQACHQKSPIILNYDEFTKGANFENLNFLAQKLRMLTGLELPTPTQEFAANFNKQDQSESVSAKVSNWEKFEQQLQQKKLLNAAFGSFLEMR